MGLPRNLRGKRKEWKIRTVKKIEGGALGEADLGSKVVRIERGLKPQLREWVFWHEVGHILFAETMIARDDVGLPALAEELFCDDFADFMTENFNVSAKRKRK